MKSAKPKLLRNTLSALIIFGALSLIPNSFADELIQNITEVITEPAADEVIVDEVAAEKELPVVEPSPSPGDLEITDATGDRKTYFNVEYTIIKQYTR